MLTSAVAPANLADWRYLAALRRTADPAAGVCGDWRPFDTYDDADERPSEVFAHLTRAKALSAAITPAQLREAGSFDSPTVGRVYEATLGVACGASELCWVVKA